LLNQTFDRETRLNPDSAADDPQTTFYDSDYPWPEDALCAAARAEGIGSAGTRADIDGVLSAARTAGGPALGLCCGTGRLSLPLAREGFQVTGVDISPRMLGQFRARLANEPEEVKACVEIIEGDACALDLGRAFGLVFVGFNSFNIVATLDNQKALLASIARHLSPGGLGLIQLYNPLQHSPHGMASPILMATRRLPDGRSYRKFGLASAMRADQTQTITGWYDVTGADAGLARHDFRMEVRHVFPSEFTLMAEAAGLTVRRLMGGFSGEDFHFGARSVLALVGRA
jgi:SAM-dependent methyltransferase